MRDEAEHKADSGGVEVGARRCRDAEGIKILAVIHGTNARGGVFEETVREAGHVYEEWDPAWGTPLPRPLEDYDGAIVFGGTMHPDQEEEHPWLAEETTFIQGLLDRDIPTLGICLGIQLFAKAAGARVYPLTDGPEIGWVPVELTPPAREDPVFGALPERFDALAVHVYSYDVPAQAEEMVVGPRCNQAFRIGDRAWAMQFHPEATLDTVRGWLFDGRDVPGDRDAVWAETQKRIAEWNDLGRRLCGAFLATVEREAAVAA